MLKIYITRHGQDEDNAAGLLNGHRDRPLTALGVKQAHQLAAAIKEHGLVFDAVYASPLQRALKTAVIVSQESGQPEPIVMDELIERDFGVMTGEKISSVSERCAPDVLVSASGVTYFVNAPQAEDWDDVLTRAHGVLETIREKHADDNAVLLVAHGDIGKMLYAAFYNLTWEEVVLNFHFGNGDVALLEEGLDKNTAKIISLRQFNA